VYSVLWALDSYMHQHALLWKLRETLLKIQWDSHSQWIFTENFVNIHVESTHPGLFTEVFSTVYQVGPNSTNMPAHDWIYVYYTVVQFKTQDVVWPLQGFCGNQIFLIFSNHFVVAIFFLHIVQFSNLWVLWNLAKYSILGDIENIQKFYGVNNVQYIRSLNFENKTKNLHLTEYRCFSAQCCGAASVLCMPFIFLDISFNVPF
jgi:hypothetical protein